MRESKKAENRLKASGEIKVRVPDKREDPYEIEENQINLLRGTKMSLNELYQFERWLGQKVFSKSFFSTTTS